MRTKPSQGFCPPGPGSRTGLGGSQGFAAARRGRDLDPAGLRAESLGRRRRSRTKFADGNAAGLTRFDRWYQNDLQSDLSGPPAVESIPLESTTLIRTCGT